MNWLLIRSPLAPHLVRLSKSTQPHVPKVKKMMYGRSPEETPRKPPKKRAFESMSRPGLSGSQIQPSQVFL
jgi:hypothetical protein